MYNEYVVVNLANFDDPTNGSGDQFKLGFQSSASSFDSSSGHYSVSIEIESRIRPS